MQIVRVFKPQTERKNFFGVGWCSKFRSQHDRAAPQKIFEREEARKQENRERTPPVLSSSASRFVYEEAWEEDFDEHSQQ